MKNVNLEKLPKYEPPKVVTLDKKMILEELGPARTVYGAPSGFLP
jgi:hypothetical protein